MLTSNAATLAACGPLALLAISLPLSPLTRLPIRSMCRLATTACTANLALAVGLAAWVFLAGDLRTPTYGIAGIGFGIYLDTLSATMFALVSFIGLIVVAYSQHYLDGDPRHRRFIQLLCATLCAVVLIVISNNLLQLLLAWIATSIGLHYLLLFYPGRMATVFAARKRCIAARVGEACLVIALLITHRWFHTLDYGVLVHPDAARLVPLPMPLQAISMLLVGAAMLKSAQFPLHGWLTEVMETPTPVSALLHAGIINAGGFLVLRFSHLVALSMPALETLAIVGAVTALFGSVVMLTQTSIKVSLAYSTIAQMGFMMLECGLTVFPAALVHLVAHSLYKAHAFLSSGSIVDIARSSWTPSLGGGPHPARQIIAIAAVLMVAIFVAPLFHLSPLAQPGLIALAAIVALGVVVLLAGALDEQPSAYVIVVTVVYANLVVAAYFMLQIAAERLFRTSLSLYSPLPGPVPIATAGIVVVAFALVTFFQAYLSRMTQQRQAVYAHVSHGLYVNTVMNRVLLRFWPPSAAQPQRGRR